MAEARNSVELGAFSFNRPRSGSIEVDGAIQIDLQVCVRKTQGATPRECDSSLTHLLGRCVQEAHRVGCRPVDSPLCCSPRASFQECHPLRPLPCHSDGMVGAHKYDYLSSYSCARYVGVGGVFALRETDTSLRFLLRSVDVHIPYLELVPEGLPRSAVSSLLVGTGIYITTSLASRLALRVGRFVDTLRFC